MGYFDIKNNILPEQIRSSPSKKLLLVEQLKLKRPKSCYCRYCVQNYQQLVAFYTYEFQFDDCHLIIQLHFSTANFYCVPLPEDEYLLFSIKHWSVFQQYSREKLSIKIKISAIKTILCFVLIYLSKIFHFIIIHF